MPAHRAPDRWSTRSGHAGVCDDGRVKPRAAMRVHQLVARVWLTVAAASLALPPAARAGLWLPLHLTLAGAVATAISGAVQNFSSALMSAPSPPPWAVRAQLGALVLGVVLIAVGVPGGLPALVAAGGGSFVAAMVLLGWIVVRARRRGLNRRHTAVLAAYLGAVSCVVGGAAVGAALGAGIVRDPAVWLALRSAHAVLNVLGFVSVTILATLVTLLPTVLRVRMSPWHGARTGAASLGGAVALALGLALRSWPIALAGGIAFGAGAATLAWVVVHVVRTPRTGPAPLAARHVLAGFGWFLVGCVALLVSLARGSFGPFLEPFLVIFVGGWTVQVLLGAWLYLLPVARPGHPDERRRQLAAIEIGGRLELALLNLGLLLLASRAAGWAPSAVGELGAGLSLAGGGIALVKAWTFPFLGRVLASGAETGRRGKPGGGG
jgi:nitrite reductase (NO-forming)